MTIVWGVTAGSYSDYRVIALFTTKDKAEEFIKKTLEHSTGDFNDIEEFELDPETAVWPFTFKYFYDAKVAQDGYIAIYHADEIDMITLNADIGLYGEQKVRERFWWDSMYNHPDHYNEKEPVVCLHAYVNANSEKHAIKILGEKRSRLLAQRKWPLLQEYWKMARKEHSLDDLEIK